MTDHEARTAAEYLNDLQSSDPRLTRRVAVESMIDAFALSEDEAQQVWSNRNEAG